MLPKAYSAVPALDPVAVVDLVDIVPAVGEVGLHKAVVLFQQNALEGRIRAVEARLCAAPTRQDFCVRFAA